MRYFLAMKHAHSKNLRCSLAPLCIQFCNDAACIQDPEVQAVQLIDKLHQQKEEPYKHDKSLTELHIC